MKQVPFFNYKYFYESEGSGILSVIENVMRRGAYIMQQEMFDFEKRIADYLNVKHVLSVANGTDALEMSLQVLGIKSGDEVIFPSHTFVATASAIHVNGATPIPVECGADHMMDPKAVEKAITKRTKAIMPVQLNGRTCDMDALTGIAEKYGLFIVEDAAQGLGSKFKNRFAGTFGSLGTFSLYPAKLLGCLGDGGIVVTNDDELAEKVYALRDHGRMSSGKVAGWGRNSRLDTLQAAVLNYLFDHYDATIARRREIAQRYHEQLSGCKDLILPPKPDTGDHFDVYQNYEIESSHRDLLKQYLVDQGVGTLKQWGGETVHQIQGLGLDHYNLPFTERMIARSLLLPMNISLKNDDVDYVCEQVLAFYALIDEGVLIADALQ